MEVAAIEDAPCSHLPTNAAMLSEAPTGIGCISGGVKERPHVLALALVSVPDTAASTIAETKKIDGITVPVIQKLLQIGLYHRSKARLNRAFMIFPDPSPWGRETFLTDQSQLSLDLACNQFGMLPPHVVGALSIATVGLYRIMPHQGHRPFIAEPRIGNRIPIEVPEIVNSSRGWAN